LILGFSSGSKSSVHMNKSASPTVHISIDEGPSGGEVKKMMLLRKADYTVCTGEIMLFFSTHYDTVSQKVKLF
jgi:hypothetical protein